MWDRLRNLWSDFIAEKQRKVQKVLEHRSCPVHCKAFWTRDTRWLSCWKMALTPRLDAITNETNRAIRSVLQRPTSSIRSIRPALMVKSELCQVVQCLSVWKRPFLNLKRGGGNVKWRWRKYDCGMYDFEGLLSSCKENQLFLFVWYIILVIGRQL